MPIDTCVQNVGEYYSSHYLDSTFARDMQQLQSPWREQGSRSVPRRLQALSERYFRAKSRALDEERPERRVLLGDEIAGWHGLLLDALGYIDREPADVPVDANTLYVPVLGRVFRYGKPWLFLTEAPFALPDSSLKDGMPSEDPLESEPLTSQLRDSTHKLCPGDWSRAVGKIFTEEDAPRWILMLGGSRLLLLDRNTFAQARYLAFDLDNAYGRPERASFDCMAALLSAETLCPSGESAELFHEKLETQSHKFAHGVSDKLQSAVREAIEILANEWVDYRKRKQLSYTSVARDGVLPEDQAQVTAERLRHEALVFVYRLLFCFYAEAHGTEVNILPVNADEYRLGYSLEALRDLEQVPLTPETEIGEYFDHHVRQLFRLVYEGFNPEPDPAAQVALALEAEPPTERAFSIRPLTATLFHSSSTPLFNLVRFSNLAWQKIIRNLSLSKDDRSNTVGRVNYAELGLNELGAVYEGLLSYKGMFVPADRDYIQVKRAGEDVNDSNTPTWFVLKDRLDEFRSDEVGRLPNGQPRIYPRGSFVLHLNGVDREQSASYYTPKPLTECLVREALRELLEGLGPADADRILDLTICEPAMGSGAFLYEAARQLADKYLELKVQQTGGTIEPGDYADERRRVMHFITTRNIYGVDLNETAVELAGLSLWLGSIHRLPVRRGANGTPTLYESCAPPWFGLRLRTGNSLIGARRAVWTTAQLKDGLHAKDNGDTPRSLKPGEPRADDEVYHFLVFDPDMVASCGDSRMREHWPEHCNRAKRWIKDQIKPKWSDVEIKDALEICTHIDRYWMDFTERRKKALETTACTTSVWPTSASSEEALKPSPTLEYQETVKAELESSSGAFQRLRLLMDTWCSLWFWPLTDSDKLPSREAWLASARLLAGETIPAMDMWHVFSMHVGFDVSALLAVSSEVLPDSDALAAAVPWFRVSRTLAGELHFQHWELAFPEILGPASHKGFDLVLGNPPWRKATWNDTALLYELDPKLGVDGALSGDLKPVRPKLLESPENLNKYAKQFRLDWGALKFLSSRRLNKLLFGSQTNLYKSFVLRAWDILSPVGIGAMIHEDGVYEDPGNGPFRVQHFQRLRRHYSFRNEMALFQEVHDQKDFSLNVFAGDLRDPEFENVVNLFHPKTIESCRNLSRASAPTPGIRSETGKWETNGHPNRVVHIRQKELRLFARLIEDRGTDPLAARLPQIHSREILEVLERFSAYEARLSDISEHWTAGELIHESNGQDLGQITRHTSPTFQPSCCDEWVVSGPHFFVGTPMMKTPYRQYRSRNDYYEIDLTQIPEDFLPRAVYRPGDKDLDRSDYDKSFSRWPEGQGALSLREWPKCMFRQMCDAGNERTLISAVLPAGAGAINTATVLVSDSPQTLFAIAGATFSTPFDFLIKCKARDHVVRSDLEALPLLQGPYVDPIVRRALRLNCLTSHYSDLWKQVADDRMQMDGWTSDSERLCNEFESDWSSLGPDQWTSKAPVRTAFARRQALIEIDVLVALALGLTLDQLQMIYAVQFPITQNYEAVDEYDARGRRLPNTARKDAGAKEVREARVSHDRISPLTVSWQMDGGTETVTKVFYPPFTKTNRRLEYERAYEIFEQRYGGKA